MAFSLNEVWQVTALVTYQDQTAYNVSHRRVSLMVGPGASEKEVCDDISSKLAVFYKPMVTNSAIFYGVMMQRLQPTLGAVVTSIAGQTNGTGGTKALAGQLAGYFNLKTALGGRDQTGRKYIPFPDDAALNAADSTPSAGYMTLMGLLAAWHINPNTTIGMAGTTALDPVLYHRQLGTADAILTANAKQKWATQRRRGKFGKANPAPF